MTGFVSTLWEMARRAQRAEREASTIIESEAISELPSAHHSDVLVERSKNLDPIDRERIVDERLSELSDALGVRYRQVCRDLRDQSRLTWTSDAHDLRDILANVLRTLAPDEEVEAQEWYKLVEGTKGPTQAQRAKYILLQNHPEDDVKDAAKDATTEIELIDELVSKIVRSTYNSGSKLAHSSATHKDCVGLLFHFDALMFSLLTATNDSER